MDNFYNYYKLLGIPNCSEIEEAEKVYLQITEKLNSEPHSAGNDFLFELEKGMRILRDPKLKREYDLIILAMDQTVKDKGFARDMYRKYGNSARNPVNKFSDSSMLPLRGAGGLETNGYKKIHVVLFSIISVFYLIAPFYIEYLFWEPWSQERLLAYSILFLVNIPIAAVYTRWIFLFMVHRFGKTLKKAFKISTIVFFVVFIVYPVLIYRGIMIEKKIMLSNYAVVVPEKIDTDYRNNLYFYYRVKGKLYVQSEEPPEPIVFTSSFMKRKIRVKYSLKKPKISQVDNWDELLGLKYEPF